jgi:PBSX family phage terminase large subunit
VTSIVHNPLPHQDDALFASERHVILSGAVGAGKSYTLCLDAAIHTHGDPDARYGLFRKTRVGLIKSTLKTLLVGDGKMPPVLPPGSYTHNKTLGEIQIHGGGMIMYSGVETPEAVRSMNLSSAGIDEVIELSFEDYAAVDDRVRLDIGKPMCIKSATNPGLPSHWLAKMIGISPDKTEPDPDCKVIMTRTADNIHLPDVYHRSFERHKGTMYYDRMYLGKWVGAEGVVYADFYRDRHVIERSRDEAREVYYAIDPGYTDPFVILEVWSDGDKRHHIAREWYETGKTHADALKHLHTMMKANPEAVVVVDSAEPAFVEEARKAGVRATPAKKGPDSITAGIGLVTERLRDPGDGRPRVTVDPRCVNTIREFESYEWQEGRHGLKDKPVDANNHTMDAYRYLVQHTDQGRGFVFAGAGEVSEGRSFNEERFWA